LITENPVKSYRAELTRFLLKEHKRLEKKPAFKKLVDEAAVLDIRRRRVTVLDQEGKAKDEGTPVASRAPVADENIEDLYSDAGRQLGEGLHKEFVRNRVKDGAKPHKAKLEISALVRTEGVVEGLDALASQLTKAWIDEHKAAFADLDEKYKQQLRDIEGATTEPLLTSLDAPNSIDWTRATTEWPKHLYVDAEGKFYEDFAKSSWERAVIKEETERKDVVGWLRNPDRKPWSLCVSYRQGAKYVPVYPDFLIFRETSGGIIADIVDPHLLAEQNAPGRAAGLAQYAAKHSDQYGRIDLVIVDGEKIKQINLIDKKWRDKVAKVSTHAHLQDIFDQV
jgi:type III restriction enzyme